MMFNGFRILASPFAREVRDEFHVERHPIRKRRRGWRVVKHHIDRPGVYSAGGDVLFMHPELIANLKRAL